MLMTLNDKLALLRSAIIELKQVTANYNGYYRVFCPHILGTKQQLWKVFVWQFDGQSSQPNELPMWRDLAVQDLHSVTLQDGDWHRGWTTGQRQQKAIDTIDTVVDPVHAAVVRQILAPHTPTLGVRRPGRKK